MAKRNPSSATPPSGEAPPVAPTDPATEPAGLPALELLTETPDANPNLHELEASLSPADPSGSVMPGAPADALPGAPAAPRAGFKRWKSAEHRRATRRAMSARIKELEAIAAEKPAGASTPDGAPAPELSPDALLGMAQASLAATFGVVSGIGARMRGDHWRLSPEEVQTLAGAWAPVVAPYLGGLSQYLPVVAAVAVTAEIAWPRIERDMQLAKVNAAEPLPASSPEPATSPNAAE